jgi:hypothetical protein
VSLELSLLISVFFLAVVLAIILTLVDNLFYSLQRRLSKRLIKPEMVEATQSEGFKGRLKKFGVSGLQVLLIFCMGIEPTISNLNDTVLSTNFVVEELRKLDIRTVVKELFQQDLTGLEPYKAAAVENTLTAMDPWLHSQAEQTILQIYPYLLGETDNLNLSLSLTTLKDTLRMSLEQTITDSPPPEYSGYTSEQNKSYMDETYNKYFEKIPEALIVSSEKSTWIPLNGVRNAIKVIKLLSIMIIPLIVLICLGIILLTRKVKTFTRKIGTSIVLAGLLGFTYSYVLKLLEYLMTSVFAVSALQKWLIQVTVDVLAVVQEPGLWIVLIGAIILIVSFVYKREPVS